MGFITTPFALLLRYLSIWLDSYGFALLVFALIVTVIRVPFDIKTKRGTMGQTLLQPKIKAIQEKYAGNQQKIMQEQNKLFKEEGIKPMGGCIWMVFPMIIMIILIGIVREPLTHLMNLDPAQIESLRTVLERLGYEVGTGAHAETEIAGYIRPYYAQLHAAVPQIFDINMRFLGMNIGETPNWRFFLEPDFTAADAGLFFLPVFSTATVYLMQKVMSATNYMQQQAMQQMQMMKTMMLVMPLMSLFIGFTFPAAMSIYWIVNSLSFTAASALINLRFKGIYAVMQAEMEAKDKEREAVLEAKRQETERLRALNATQENKGTSKKKKQLADREKERQRLAAQRALEREDEESDEEANPSREGHRRYARGRAYAPDRFEGMDEDTSTDLDADDEEEFLVLSADEFVKVDDVDLDEDDSDLDEEDDLDYYDDDEDDDDR